MAKVFENNFGQVVENPSHLILCLFGLMKATKFGFRQNTDPRSTDPLLTPLLTPYKINGKIKIKKAQNYQWDPIQVHH